MISGAISVPGLGPFTFHQPLPLIASLLTEISAFAVLGGLVGAMLGPGIPEDEVRQYARNIRQGKVLVAILANREMVDQVIEILNRHRPLEVKEERISRERIEQMVKRQEKTSAI